MHSRQLVIWAKFFREKPVPAVSLHALTFHGFIRKPCSGLQAMVGHPDVTFPATTD
jgi:hypothetical protein